MRKVMIVLVVLGWCVVGWAQDTRFYTPPIISVPRVASGPRLDGIIEPNEWAGAATLSPFVLVGGRALPSYPTTVFVMYDSHSLYIAAIMGDPKVATLKADVVERDGPVWEDDSLQLFFDTDDERKTYIHLAVNALETQYDALMKDKSADYRWNAEVATLADGWAVEMELPFANDTPPATGISWGLSVARHVAADGEVSAWDRKLKEFHELANFGSMVFSDRPVLAQLGQVGGLWLGDNAAQIVTRNVSGQGLSGKINTRVMGRDKYGHFTGFTKFNLGAGARETVNAPYSVYQDGFATVTFSMTDENGNTTWRSAPYPIMTPEVAPTIARVEKALAAATRSWAALPAGETKASLQPNLDNLNIQWRYLVAQYRDRAKLTRAELETLAQFADRLRTEAEMLQDQMKTATLTGAVPGFGLAGTPSTEHVFPEGIATEPGEAPVLDACRNETETMQVVVLPFR